MAEHHYKVDEEEERRIIIDKYERGREKVLLEGIDEWEDPAYEIYQVTDRYGFIHDHKLPDKLSKHENQLRETEAKRRDKWFKMIKNWSTYKNKNYDKLRDRVFKGIPNAVRGNAWLLLLDVPHIKEEQQNRYDEMYNLGKQYSKEVRQIDLDINRTFRNNIMFRERYNTKQQELFRVLVAYSVYNSEIGYCQSGMSQIAALLLMFTSEEDTFWALDRLMTGEKYAMHGFFIPGFPKLQRFAKHHDLVLKRFLNKVYKHFRKNDIESTLYTLKWFFQCFLDRVPFSLTLRLWDTYMIDGERILTCMSYTLLKLHRKTILKKSMDNLIPFLQIDLEKDFGYHDDEAIAELQKSIEQLHKYKMDVPLEAASESEKPSRPFGFISQTAETVSINDDRSVVESELNFKPFSSDREDTSIANTSRTSSNININEYKEDLIDDDLMNKSYPRKLSFYDNVDPNESFEAAKRLAIADVLTESRDENNQNNANSKQSADEEQQFEESTNQQISTKAAINQPTTINSKQLNGQLKHTQQEKNRTFVVEECSSNEFQVDNTQNGSVDKSSTGHLVRQTKATSSFKLLKRKSSIPTMKRTDSQRKSTKNDKPTDKSNDKSNDKSTDKSTDRPVNKLDDTKPEHELVRSSSMNKQTPNRSSLIPRFKQTSATKNTSFDRSIVGETVTTTTIKSSIPTNNSTMKTNLGHQSTDDTPRPIKIYVPYAEIASKNNSRNSLTSSTNSINLNNGANGLKGRKDDLNKITINVNQKYTNNDPSIKNNLKSYLPTIDT